MQAQQPAALAELTQSVLAGADLPTLAQRVTTLVADALMVEHSAIWELPPDGSELILRAGVGWQADAIGQATLEVGLTPAARYAELRSAPLVVVHWCSEARLQPPALRDHEVMSSLCVVIPGQTHAFGILSADSTALRTFSGEEMLFMQALANVLALGIQRGHSNPQLEQRLEARTRDIEQQLVAAAQDKAVLEERQRLARDLHDSVTQALYSVTLHAEAATRLLASGDATTTAKYLRELQETAQEALDEMRLLIFDLRPPALEQVGLVAALQARLNAVEGRANLETRLITDGVGDLPSVVEQALYRIAQEALNNALKHAHAQRITVLLRRAQPRLILEIDDDGIGFDLAAARQTGGMGLRGIAERVAQLKGIMAIQSTPGAGTQVRVEVIV